MDEEFIIFEKIPEKDQKNLEIWIKECKLRRSQVKKGESVDTTIN